MKQGLKIYACSGLNLSNGVGTSKEDFDYWLDNTQTIFNTCAINILLAGINYRFSRLQYDNSLSDSEVIKCLNEIDLLVVCLQFAKKYKDNTEELQRAGSVIAQMLQENYFTFDSWDNDERDRNLDSLIVTAQELFLKSDVFVENAEFYNWYLDNVVYQSYEGYTKEQQAAAQKFLIKQSNISGTKKAEAGQYLTNSGSYYFYLYMNKDSAKKATTNIQWKRNKQDEVYKYVSDCYLPLYGNKQESINEVLYAGYLSTYKHTPKEMIDGFTNNGGSDKIGDGGITLTAAMIVKIIIAVISFVAAALTAILGYCATVKSAKYSAPVQSDLAIASPEDIEEQEKNTSAVSKITDTIKDNPLIALGIVGALIYFKNNNE